LIALCVDLLRGFGFTANDVVVRSATANSGSIFLRAQNVPEEKWPEMLQIIDKSERETREKTAEKLGPIAEPTFKILDSEGSSENSIACRWSSRSG